MPGFDQTRQQRLERARRGGASRCRQAEERVRTAITKLERNLGRPPTTRELSDKTGISLRTIQSWGQRLPYEFTPAPKVAVRPKGDKLAKLAQEWTTSEAARALITMRWAPHWEGDA